MPRVLVKHLTPAERAEARDEALARLQLADDIHKARIANGARTDYTHHDAVAEDSAIYEACLAGFGFVFEEVHLRRGEASVSKPTKTTEPLPPPQAMWSVLVAAPIGPPGKQREARAVGFRWAGNHYRKDGLTPEGVPAAATAARKLWPTDSIQIADPAGNTTTWKEA